VPGSGFFEWLTEDRGKTTYHFTLAIGGLFAIAGL
jgi:putative SOS response-associated peptidase YedK